MTPAEVVHQMQAAGLEQPPLPLDTSGKITRFGPKKNQWYRLRELRTDAGNSRGRVRPACVGGVVQNGKHGLAARFDAVGARRGSGLAL